MVNLIHEPPAPPKRHEFPVVKEFADGLEGSARPSPEVVGIASRITEVARAKTVQPEISVDIDGALSFDLRLASGLLLVAELDADGTLEALLIDDERDVIVKRLPNTDAATLIALFE